MKKIVLGILKYGSISTIVLAALLFLLPIIFPSFVSDKIKKWTNQTITGELNFTKSRLSFFNHFPSLTLTLYNVNLKGSAPYKKDTLLAANEVALGVNLLSIFSSSLKIDEIYVTNGIINILVNEQGYPNYNIYKSANNTNTKKDNDTTSAALKLERIEIENCELVYNDLSVPIVLHAQSLNYIGKGDLSNEIFDLASTLTMQDFDLSYSKGEYLKNKYINAKLITRINTNSLELDFQKNDLVINQLPLQLQGKFSFLKNGYHFEMAGATPLTAFKHLFTALPPAYTEWVNKNTVEGLVQLSTNMKGDFIASENKVPDFELNLKIENGKIKTAFVPEPMQDIQLNTKIILPKLNIDSVRVSAPILKAKLGTDFIDGAVFIENLVNPLIKADVKLLSNLEKLTQFFALDSIWGVQLKGNLQINTAVNGTMHYAKNKLPISNTTVKWQNGFIKTKYYSSPIQNIDLNASLQNTSNGIKDFVLNINPMHFMFEQQPFTLVANLKNLQSLLYKVNAKGTINVGKLYKLFAVEGVNVNGLVKVNMQLQGSQKAALKKQYHLLKNTGTASIKSIQFTTPYYPHPFVIKQGKFHVKNDALIADNLLLTYLQNALQITGSFTNIINFIVKDNAALQGNINVSSNQLNLSDFIIEQVSTSSNTNTNNNVANTVIQVPQNLQLTTNVVVNTLKYNGIHLQNFNAKAAINKQQLSVPNASFNFLNEPVAMQLFYKPLSAKKASFGYTVNTGKLDIENAYKQITLLQAVATSLAKVKGTVQLNYTLSGLLNNEMQPILPTIKGKGALTLSNIKVYGFKLFNAISKATNKTDIANPDLSKRDIIIKSTIQNNIINIERIKLRVAGFRPRFEGQISLDGKLNLKARLGLPPFGIIGIPLSVTGTQDKPIVKLKRNKHKELEETKPDEEDTLEAEEAAKAQQ